MLTGLQISIYMKQTEGDKNFIACVSLMTTYRSVTDKISPPLKTAQVFNGIAGIMAGEQGDSDDVGSMHCVDQISDCESY